MFDVVAAAVFAGALLVVAAPPVLAYVDPSVITYTIQALAGVVVALSAVFGVVFRKTRRVIFEALGIDENAHKEVEPPIHRGSPGVAACAAEGTMRSGIALRSSRKPGRALTRRDATHASTHASDDVPSRLRWPVRLGYAALASAFLSFTVCIVAPYETLAANSGSLIYGISEVGGALAVFAIIAAVVLALLLSCLRGRAFDAALFIVTALALGAYVQAMFMNSSLPAADGRQVMWKDYDTIAVISSAVWLALVIVPFAVARTHRVLMRKISLAVAVVLIIVQGVGVASLFTTGGTASAATVAADEKIYCTEDGLNTLSSKGNVVVFVLDTFDTADMQQILADDSSYYGAFQDFTYFKNSTGAMIPTRYAIPFLLSGRAPVEGESASDYFTDYYRKSDFLSDIQAAGWTSGIYTDSIGRDMSTDEGRELAAQTMNYHSLDSANVDEVGAVRTLLQCALYRDLPWMLKTRFWYSTDQVNNSMSEKSVGTDFAQTEYKMDDVAYYRTLKTEGLELDEGTSNGAFRFIHLLGAHEPYVMDENCKSVNEDEGTLESQEKGSLKIVEQYLQKMKDLGVYDNSTIIITADHGYWYLTMDDIEEATSPIMIVKPANTSGTHSDMKTSDMPVSHFDFQATVISGMGGDSSKYGQTVFQVNDANRKRFYYMTTHDGKHDYEFRQYEIDGDALDFSNWHKTGLEWQITPRS